MHKPRTTIGQLAILGGMSMFVLMDAVTPRYAAVLWLVGAIMTIGGLIPFWIGLFTEED